MSSQPRQQLDLATLTAQQLSSVKRQLDDELTHLNNSFTQLRGASARFNDCSRSIERGINGQEAGQQILVPLTTSLYVPGRLASTETVLVDVGTGFFVEKTIPEANKYFEEKTKEIGKNLKDLEGVLQGKSNNLRMVEDVLRQKVMQGQDPNGGPSQSSAGAPQVGA